MADEAWGPDVLGLSDKRLTGRVVFNIHSDLLAPEHLEEAIVCVKSDVTKLAERMLREKSVEVFPPSPTEE